MHQIDASFRKRKEAVASRRRRARTRKALAAALGVGLASLAAGYYLTSDKWSFGMGEAALEPVAPPHASNDPQPAVEPVFVPAIVDLAGDPMIIHIGSDSGNQPKTKVIARPEKLLFPGISDQLTVLSDVMLSSSERFMTTLPSTQEDFAFFQAQRSQPPPPMTTVSTAPPAEQVTEPGEIGAGGPAGQTTMRSEDTAEEAFPEDEAVSAPTLEPAEELLPEGSIPDDVELAPVEESAMPASAEGAIPELPAESGLASGDGEADDTGAGWGETVAEGREDLPEFKRTRVEDTTSIAFLTPELGRFRQTEDFFVKVKSSRSVDGIVLDQGFSSEDAKAAGEALKTILKMEALQAGFVVAMRGFRETLEQPGFRLVQLSVYADASYLGSLARGDDGGFVAGADPWVDQDLFSYSGAQDEQATAPKQQYRLLDAIYSTAARNSVPTGVIGEAIMLLSRSHDLNGFASHEDRFLLVYSHEARDANEGRVLYAAVRGQGKNFECFVFRPQAGGDFACMTEDNLSTTVTLTNGMVTPVNGVMKSTFGPRKHPILGVVRIHKGVDWAAPIGSPVFAAFDGTVAYAGDGGDYGNVIKISHDGGRETRYAHLSRFAPETRPGAQVKAGDIIGHVGTTGLSTGPHLHFELYLGKQAIDPLQTAVAEVRSDDSAVQTLVDKIIRVESGGNAKAKNPLSSATGLGQFISSTWLRMMRTYRPDLARSLSQADQLALRFDPTLSREMVTHLAQEGEAYLRARGHAITAGRLYLCHFLGMEGAHIVLAASPEAPLIDVLGSGVIKANPFLTGKNAAHVVAWAERKMSGKAVRMAPSAPSVTKKEIVRASPEFERYRGGVSEIVAAIAGPLPSPAPPAGANAAGEKGPGAKGKPAKG